MTTTDNDDSPLASAAAETTTADNTLVAFKAICNFVKDLNFAFGDRLPPLQLYAHLLEKTGLIHEEPIRKHVAIFQEFVDTNEEGILQKSISLLQKHHILRYSDKVYINLNAIIQLSEPEDITTLWTHLLAITAILRPQTQARDLLRRHHREAQLLRESAIVPGTSPPGTSSAPPSQQDDDEEGADPFQNIGGLLQSLLGGLGNLGASSGGDGNAGATPPNPMDMIGSLMNSPALSAMMKNLNEGDLDMPKLVDGMQKTLSTLQTVLQNVAPPSSAPSADPSTPAPPS